MKGSTCSDKPTENYHKFFSSCKFCGASFSSLFWLLFNPIALSNPRFQQQAAVCS